MASDFLRKKAREREALINKENSADAYAGSSNRKDRDEDTDKDKMQNTPGGSNAAGSGSKASDFLKKKASERAAAVDKQNGSDAYGGSKWLSERKDSTVTTQNSPTVNSNAKDKEKQGFLDRIKDSWDTAYSRVYGKDDAQGTEYTTSGSKARTETQERLDALKDKRTQLNRSAKAAQRIGSNEMRQKAMEEIAAVDQEIAALSKDLDELEAARPVYTNEIAEQKAAAVTNAESALKQTRPSGVDIETELQQRSDSINNLNATFQRLGEVYKADPTDENYTRYLSAAQQLDLAAKDYNALYDEYTKAFSGYKSAYDDYMGYMTDAKSDASGLDIAGKTVRAGVGSIARAFGSTLDFVLPAELWDEKDPLSWTINKQAEEAKQLNAQWEESIYGRSNKVKGAAMLGKATVEAIPNAILAYMSGGTSVAAQGTTAALQTAAAGAGVMSATATVVNQMVRNPMYWSSVAQTLGPTYDQAIENGASEWQASATAIITSAINAGVEVSGGIEVLPAKLRNGNANDVLLWVMSTPEEGVEEVVQSLVSGTVDKTIYDYDKPVFSTTDPDAIVNPKEMGQEFAMGTAVGGILGGVQVGGVAAANAITNHKLGKIGGDYQVSAEELIEEGLSFAPETEAYQTAQEVKAKVEAGESLTDADLGRVVVANERTMQQEESLAQANTPRNTTNSEQDQSVSDVLKKVSTQDTQEEAPLKTAQNAQEDALLNAAREAVGAETPKQSVPYNVMSTDNPERRAAVAAKKQTGYGEEGLKLYQEIAKSNNVDKVELMLRFDAPYQAGLTGLEMKDANLLNDFQIEAYNAGRRDHIARMSADNLHKIGAVLSEAESGFDFTGAPKSISQAERTFADSFLKKLGVKGGWDGQDGKAAYNAFFDSSTGGVTFAQDFGIDPKLMERLGSEAFMKKVEKLESTRDGSFMFYVAHEVATHVAMDRAPTEMRAFVNAMYNYKQGMAAGENSARSKQAFYASKKVDLTTEGAIEEVVADAILDLYNGDAKAFMTAMERIMNGKDEQAKKGARTYLERLKEAIAKLKAWAKKLVGKENAEARANMEKGISELEQLRDMFEQAMSASVKAVETARKNPSQQTAPVVGEIKNSIKGYATAAGIDAIRDPATGKVVFKVDGKAVTKVTPAHIKQKSGLGGLITTAMDNGFISAFEADIQYKAAADIMNMIINTQDPEMVWAWVGSSMFSAIKSNADGQYGTTVDFTTVCRKTQDMITAMSKAMMKMKRGLTKDEVTKLQAELIAEGSSVPCPVCYVFSRWAGIGSVLDNMYRWQEKYDGYTNAQIRSRIDELSEKLGKGKTRDLAKMLRDQDEEYDNLSYEKEKLALEKKQLTSKKKAAVKDNDARALVDINNRLAEIDKRTPKINKRLNDIKASVAPELAWLMQVRYQPDYAAHGKVRPNVLFNLDDAATFAEEFPLAWKYRTSRGPSAGKAILPYSDMRLGDMILGVDKTSADGNTLFANATGEFTDAQKAAVEKAIARTKAQNLIGGQRFQSTSDFRYDYALDYLMAFWEAQAIGSKMQTYTKIVEFGDMVAAVGGDFNLSVMPRNKGYITLPNGKNQLVFSSVTGIDFEAAKRSVQMHDNGQMILVGINDQHILAALEDSEETRGAYIGFVIPYHASGASINEFIRVLVSNLGETYQSKSYQDYSDVQSDKERSNATSAQKRRNDLRTKLLRGKDGGKNWEPTAEDLDFIRGESVSIVGRSFADLRAIERKALRGDKAAIAEYESWTAGALWDLYNKMWVEGGKEYGVRLNTSQAKSVMPHEYWNKTVNRDQAYINGFLFRSYCYNLGLIPRFTGAVVKGEKHGDFSDSKGYWKTLIDRPMYRNDGTYRDQQIINMSTFNMEMLKPDYAKQNWEGYAVQEPDVQRATRAAERFVEKTGDIKYSLVKGKETLDFLNGQEWVKVYRAMYQDETGLYPPMGAIQGGKKVAPVKFDTWYQADEHPELIKFEVPARYVKGEKTSKGDFRKSARFLTDEEINANRAVLYGTRKDNAVVTLSSGVQVKFKDLKPKFNLEKADGGTDVPAAYNPYFHTSLSALNDQFDTAYKRPGLVVVEGYIPKSELTSGYRAMYAKDPVGETTWKSGVVANHLKGDKARKVFLSRWFRAERVVPDAEAAKMIAGVLDGEDLKVPWNVVTPALREALESAGVEIDYDRVYAGTSFDDFQKSANQTGRATGSDGKMKYSLNGGAKNGQTIQPGGNQSGGGKDRQTGGKRVLSSLWMLNGSTRPVHRWAEGGLIVPEPGSVAANEADVVVNEYGLPVFVVKDSIFDQNHTTAPAFAADGQVFLRETLPDIGLGDIGAHEAGHAMKQRKFEPYIKLLPRVKDMMNSTADSEVLKKHAAKHCGVDLKNCTPAQERDVYDEICNLVMGAHHAQRQSDIAIVRGCFTDFDSFLAELVDIHEQYKQLGKKFSLKGEKSMRDEIKRIRTEGEKAGKSEAEIENDIMGVVGPEYGALIKAYGEIKRGERPAREIKLPRKTEEDRRVSQTIRTVLEAEVTPEAAVPTIEQMVAQGDFSYDVITDKAAMAGAEKFLRSRGYATALSEWIGEVKAGKVSKANTAIGWALYNQAANEGDLQTAMTILNYMVGHQRNAAQAVQATRILKKMTPDAQLYGVVKSVQALEEQINEGKKGNSEEAANAAGEVGKAKKDAADATRKAKVKRKGKRVEIDSNMVGEPFVFEYAQKVGEALASGLEKRAKQTEKQRTFLQEITAQLNRFAAEKFPKAKKGDHLTATDLLRDYIQNQAFYAEAWQAAQIELREKFADDPVFNEFINSGIGVDANSNPQNAIFMRALVKSAADSNEGKAILRKQNALGFTGMANTIAEKLIEQTGATGEMADTIRDAAASYVYDKLAESTEVKDSTIESWINSAMRDIGLKLSDVVMNGTGESAKQAIVDKLVSKYGFGYAEATYTADVVAEHFDRMSRKFAENRLKAMFSDRQNVRKTIPEQIERLARLGAFDVGSAYNQKAAERIFKTGTTLTVNEDLAREFLKAKTQEERDRILADIYRDIGRQMPSTFVDKWNAWRYLAMLGNPRTHVRNILGNAFFAPVVVTKNLTATGIERVVGFVSRGKLERTKAMPGRDLLKAAWADYANVVDEISGSGKYSDAAMKNKFIEEGRTIFKTKALEKARKGNSAALEAEDMWFAQPHYAFALAQYCKANGVTADQLRRGKALGNARAYAIKEAQKATYRDTNAFSETISQMGRYHGDNKVKKGVSVVMEGVLPFRKTPANILMRGLEYSPMGLLKSLTWDLAKVKKGDITAAEAIDNVAAGLTGTGLLGLGIYLAAEGLIRGAGGDDEDEKKFEELQGHQAYALELPDGTSVTLDWLAPEVLPLFIGVNLYEMARDNKGKSNLSDILTAVSNVTEPLLEMSCLQSLNDVFDSVGYASSGGLSALPSALASAATSYLTQAFPTIAGQIERSAQDVRMTTYTEKDKFLTSDMQYTLGKISAKVPGWDFQQIPYIDAWGRTESTGSTAENTANNFLNPAYTSQIETSAMEAELARLYEATGESSVLPDRAQKYFTVAGERKDLTAEEYVEYATEKGQMAYDLLVDLTSRSEYRNASDAEKADAVERAYEYATAIAKTKVSDYEPDGWVAKAIEAEKFSGMDETEYMLYKLALSVVDQPNESGELGTYTAEEKSAAIATRRGLSNADIAAIWDTEDGYDLYDAGIDMRAYVEYIGTGGSVSAEKLIDMHSKGISEDTYFEFLDMLKQVDKPTESGKMGSYTQDEAKAAIAAIPGLSRAERAALWQSVSKNWSAKSNPWR